MDLCQTFISKVLEKVVVVVTQFLDHLQENSQFEKFQSGFRAHHSPSKVHHRPGGRAGGSRAELSAIEPPAGQPAPCPGADKDEAKIFL